MKIFRVLFAALFLSFIGLPASAMTITFDDIPTEDDDFGIIPDGYAGMNWTNFYALNTATYADPSGYLNGVVSKDNIAFNGNGLPAGSVNSGSVFTLVSGTFISAWNDGLSVNIVGKLGSFVKYTTTLTLNTYETYLATLNWSGIDTIEFSSYDGTAHGYTGGLGPHFAFDNLVISSVPLPAALPLFAGAVAFLGGVAARKRKA